MKERVNQNGFKVQNITVNERGGLLYKLHGRGVFIGIKPSKFKMVLVLMRLFQKVLGAGKIPAGVQCIFDKPMRTFHIALIGLSPGWNGFMRSGIRKLNNFGKKCFFETIPWSSKLSTIVGLDCYFRGLDAISL